MVHIHGPNTETTIYRAYHGNYGRAEFIEAGQDGKQTRYTAGAAASRIDQIGYEWERKHLAEKVA